MVELGADSGFESVQEVARGFRRGSAGFVSELDTYLHRRLRLCAVVLAVATVVVCVNSMVTQYASGRYRTSGLLDSTRLILLIGVFVAITFVIVLSRPNISRGWILVLDAGLAWSAILACVAYYEVGWANGPTYVVPILGLFLVARAIFVPCRAVRTFWLSVPAIPAILAVQLLHGEFFADANLRYPDSSFGTIVAWNQLILILSVALATFTSRVNYHLRQRAYEATQLGQYQLEDKIGEGAMGEVYRARHALMRRPTAVKVIRAALVDEVTIARFEQEVRLTARLTHPNTIAIYDYGRTPDGTFYYAMELLDGDDLKEIVEQAGPLGPARVIHILVQVCAALSEAHERGLVHRDVKPANLMLCERGLQHDVVKVMDFGLVKDIHADGRGGTAGRGICGSPETIAPETIRGQAIRPSVDIYAVGAVGCYLLSGMPIFDASSAGAFVGLHLSADPIPPSARGFDVPPDLEEQLLACLAKDPADRPPSAAALRESLLACTSAGGWSEEAAAAWWRERALERDAQTAAKDPAAD